MVAFASFAGLAAALLPIVLVLAGPIRSSSLTGLFGTSFGIPGRAYEFDYIIVGGNAGLAVAGRLAENADLSVAVIEAGTFCEISNGNLSEVPAYDIMYAGKDKSDWQPGGDWGFVTTPQTVLRLPLSLILVAQPIS